MFCRLNWGEGCMQCPRKSRIPTLNEGDLFIELPSLWATGVQSESLLMMHPGRHGGRVRKKERFFVGLYIGFSRYSSLYT